MIKVQIPFSGFYESIHDGRFDDFISFEAEILLEEGRFEEPLDAGEAVLDAVDWKEARQVYAEVYTSQFFMRIEEEFGFFPKYKNVELHSPREYNFETDKIIVEMRMKDWLKLYNLVDKEQLSELVEDALAPRSGFIPFYSNDILDWKQPTEWEFPQTGILMEVLIEGIEEDYEQGICYDISIHELMDDCVDYEKLEDLCGMNWEGRLSSEV